MEVVPTLTPGCSCMEILNIIPSVKAPNSFLVMFKKYYVNHFFKKVFIEFAITLPLLFIFLFFFLIAVRHVRS